jgi:hypothetical protein
LPRSVDEILAHTDELARRFELAEPNPIVGAQHDALMAVRDAALARGEAERSVADAVAAARREGVAWHIIGPMLGTTGEATRQRYGTRRTDGS